MDLLPKVLGSLVLQVDDGTVISKEGVLALVGTAAEVCGRWAFAGGEFVFAAAGGGLGQGEKLGLAGAPVEVVEGIIPFAVSHCTVFSLGTVRLRNANGINGRILVFIVAQVVGWRGRSYARRPPRLPHPGVRARRRGGRPGHAGWGVG